MNNNIKSTTVPIELLRKYDRPGPRYTSYPTVPVWSDKIGIDQYRLALLETSVKKESPLAIYCHIPFCRKRCYYCGCNTTVSKRPKAVGNYLECLLKEIEKTAKLLGKRNRVSQLHFGGGTPTYLNNDEFGEIIDTIESLFSFEKNCEKSIEIDPRITSKKQLEYLAERGFNRVSLGVQDFDADVQEAIGRRQPIELVREKLNICRSLGFKGINFDLIYGLPRQTPESFAETLKKAIELRPDRLAVYSFAYLPKMRPNQSKINADELPQAENKYHLFSLAVKYFTGAGYRQIGMDHFALPKDELSTAQNDGRLFRNFMGYTVQSSDEMIGFGMSSIGYINNTFFQNISTLNKYQKSIKEFSWAVFRGKKLNDDDLIRQYLITSLMCNFKLEFENLKERFGVEYSEYFNDEDSHLDQFINDGFLKRIPGGLEITPLGKTFVRNIAMTFDTYLTQPDSKETTFSRTI